MLIFLLMFTFNALNIDRLSNELLTFTPERYCNSSDLDLVTVPLLFVVLLNSANGKLF